MRSVFPAVGIACLALVATCGPRDTALPQEQTQPIACLLETRVSPPSATLHPGDTLRAAATAGGCTGATVRFRWTSSDSTVATVNTDAGLIRAVKVGSVTITATQTDKPTVKGAMFLQVNP
jgi:hypothetical protein